MDELEFSEIPMDGVGDAGELLLRFGFNALVVWLVIRFLYYPKSRRTDYCFTFTLISLSVFFLVYLLGGVKLKIGFALGLFAIFGIIRYRTESMPVREMTYLFVVIALSVINALAVTLSWAELVAANLVFLLFIRLQEGGRKARRMACKLILYDRIDLVLPERRTELLDDLRKRTGLRVTDVEVGAMDFLRDTAMLKLHYDASDEACNSVDTLLKLPKNPEL